MQHLHHKTQAPSSARRQSGGEPDFCYSERSNPKPKAQHNRRESANFEKTNPPKYAPYSQSAKKMNSSRLSMDYNNNLSRPIGLQSPGASINKKNLMNRQYSTDIDPNEIISGSSKKSSKNSLDHRIISTASGTKASHSKNETHRARLEETLKSPERDIYGTSAQRRLSQDPFDSEQASIFESMSRSRESSSPLDQISPRFGMANRREYWETRHNQPQQETSAYTPQSLRTADLLRQSGSALLMRNLMTSDDSRIRAELSSPVSRKNQKSDDSLEDDSIQDGYRRVLDDNNKKETELGKLSSENEILKNEKALLLSECRKMTYMYETQKAAKEDARVALRNADNEVLMAHEAFHLKIRALQNIVQNAFKGIEPFEPDGHLRSKNGSFYKKVQEVEKHFDNALIENNLEIQKVEEERSNRHKDESPSKYEQIYSGELKSPRQGEVEELKRRLLRTERLLEEKDKMYEELYNKHEDMKNHFREKHEENKVHVKVIEEKLEVILDKLEIEFAAEEERIISFIENNMQIKLDGNYMDAKKKNEQYFSKVDVALKGCLDIMARAKRKIEELNSHRGNMKNWIDTENQILKQGLSAALESAKAMNNRSQSLKDTLEGYLKDAEDALTIIDSRNNNRSSNKSGGQDQVLVEDTVKNAIKLLKTLVEFGPVTTQGSWDGNTEAKRQRVRSHEESQGTLEGDELRRGLGMSGKKRNPEERIRKNDY